MLKSIPFDQVVQQLQKDIDCGRDIRDSLEYIQSTASISYENQIIYGNLQLPTILLESLSKPPYEQDHDVCDRIFTAILKLCRRELSKDTTCQENCHQILSNRGGKRILDSLANFILEDNHIIGTACYLIMCLASDSTERQRLLVEEGVSVALAAVLFQYSTDSYATEFGVRAVRNLASNDEVAAVLMSEGIHQAILKVMKENHTPIVQEQCLWAIVNLSCDTNISSVLGSIGIFEAIVETMSRNIDNADVVEASCCAIRNLISESQLNISQLVKKCDTIPISSILLQCLDTYWSRSNHDLVEVILWAIANVACCNELGSILYHHHILSKIEAIIQEQLRLNHIQLLEPSMWISRNIINSIPDEIQTIYGTLFPTLAIEIITRSIDTSSSNKSSPESLSLLSISIDWIKSLCIHIVTYESIESNRVFVTKEYMDSILHVVIDQIFSTLTDYSSRFDDIVENSLRIVSYLVKLFKSSHRIESNGLEWEWKMEKNQIKSLLRNPILSQFTLSKESTRLVLLQAWKTMDMLTPEMIHQLKEKGVVGIDEVEEDNDNDKDKVTLSLGIESPISNEDLYSILRLS